MKFTTAVLLLIILIACHRPPQTARMFGINKFSDATLREIYTRQDERQQSALIPFLQHEKSVYRQEAALALASVQSKNTVPDLLLLLADKEAEVRRAAAYALGQIGDQSAEAGLIKYAAIEKTPVVRAEILEALGKVATQKGLDYLTSLTTLSETEKAGLAWGFYRTNAKGLNYEIAVKKALTLIAVGNAQPARLGAIHFLARTPKLDLTLYSKNIIEAAEKDASPEVRMAAATALAKVKSSAAEETLIRLLQFDPDYRVRINALKALNNADYAKVKETVYGALADKNPNAALAAADYLLAKAPPEDAALNLKNAQSQANWRVRATLLGAALDKQTVKETIREDIQQRYAQSTNIYEKGALLGALSADFKAYEYIQRETFRGTSPVLASYGIQALADMRQRKDFPAALKAPFAAIFRQAILSGDVALIGISAGLLQSPDLNFKEAYPNRSFLKIARDKLVLPRDMETYQELEKTIRYFEGLPPATPPRNPFTHPIDWTLVQTILPQQKIQLITAKGPVTLQLFTEEAPGTVANFVQLARSGFFNGKNFHRVVPNFVVQGGDPRGDGWGGTDYAIRSELANLRYGEGYVGMASAGKDTESCQWFITHSPTPHLDGRYTIFAKVIAGLEVLHLLEIGDEIKAVELIP